MKKYVFSKKFGTIDLYSLILTLLILGIFLRLSYVCIISEIVTTVIECICLCLASIFLMYKGIKLREKHILGIKEMAFGATELYILSACLPKTNNTNIIWFISIGYYLFNFIGGFIAFVYSLVEKCSSNSSDSLSKVESIVVIITSVFVTLFAGIQLFM